MTVNESPEKTQTNNQPLVVGGGVQEYAFNQTIQNKTKKYRKIIIVIIVLIQVFIFLSILYSAFIQPILITRERNKNYKQAEVLNVNDGELAKKRYEEIYQNNDIEACNEFKNKEYKNPKETGGGTTSYYYTCVSNISINLKNYQICLSLKDDYSKRICLQGLATLFKDPKYCQEADSYAREEVAKEQYSQAETDRCYFNIKACSYIKNIGEKEGCVLFTSRDENVLNIDICRSFIDSKRKEECLEMVSVLENKPQYCQESQDQDNCYWSAVKITAPNLGKESTIVKDEWCMNIKKNNLKSSCLSSN